MLEKTFTMCFGCGKDNPIGLKLAFRQEGETIVAEFTPGPHFQGWNGVLHGGIVSTLLDEVMANQVWLMGVQAMTAELNIRYHRPVPIGEKLRIVSRLVARKKRIFELEGRIENQGQLLAEGHAKMLEVPGEAKGKEPRER